MRAALTLPFCLFTFALLAPLTLSEESPPAASNLHQWGAVTLFHGLPSDRVRAVAQDADGAMWFGTDNGLARYDGRRTQVVNVEGLPPRRVNALRFDEQGVLWVGTEGGAARLIGGALRMISETAGKSVTAILTPERGRAWLATAHGLVFDCRAKEDGALEVRALPEQALTSAHAEQPGPLPLTSLAVGRDGALVAGTRGRGLVRLEGDGLREVASRPRPFFVEALGRDAGGRLWLGARAGQDSGLYDASNAGRPSRAGAGLGTVNALAATPAGDLWVGTEGRGAFRFRDGRQVERFTFAGTAGGLRSDRVYAVFADREGVVWFGTDRGVCRFDPFGPRGELLGGEAESNFIRAVYRTRAGELLCGTNRGLFVFDEGRGSWRAVPQLARKAVYALAEDDAGRLLVGTSRGLYAGVDTRREAPPESVEAEEDEAGVGGGSEAETQEEEGALERERDASEVEAPRSAEREAARRAAGEERRAGTGSVRALRVFGGATYAGVYGRGVERLEGGRRTLVWPERGADARLREVTALHAEGDERLWIGTARAGVFVYEDGRVKAADAALAELGERAVWSIDGGAGRGLWFATARGLYLWRDNSLTQVEAGADVRTVAADDAAGGAGEASPAAWCATAGGGLLRVLVDKEFGALVSRIDVEQGLASSHAFALLREKSDDAAAAREAGEVLLIGTSRGLVRYRAGGIQPALLPARILSRRLHPPEELRRGRIELPYPQNSLALDAAALSSRTFPEQFQYAFTLSDARGREVKRKLSRDAQFVMENLPPGAYRVEARAFTKDLVESAPLAFAFEVGRAPFPWTTTLLAVLLVLALVALSWGAVQNRRMARASAALASANRQLASARLDLANEAERERRRIARDLHDQTLADLRSLMLLADQLPGAAANGGGQKNLLGPAAFRSEIESVSDEIRRICEDLSPSVLDNVGLAAALEWALANVVARLPEAERFEYEFACDEDLDEKLEVAPGVRMQLYRIAQEAVNNVCRHARAARVRMTVGFTEAGDLSLRLEDDGRGFDVRDKRAQRGRGLTNIRARASLVDAEVSWRRREGGGTVFTLRKAGAMKAVSAS